MVKAQNPTPNIVLIIADDLGIDVISGFGIEGEMPVTPTLDSLRAAGITFTICWASPQCSPTRAAILTGKYGINNGVMTPPGPLDLEHESIFNRVKSNAEVSYDMAVIGKWHLAGRNNFDHPAEHGVDHYEGLFDSGVEDYYEWTKVTNGVSETVTEYTTSHLTDAAIDWLEERSEPWFLWLAHAAPHSPLQAPPSDLHETPTDDNRGTYFAMIEAMDHEIGRLLSKVDSENTIVIFIGDNGTPNNVSEYYPRGHGKASIYEGGVRVPMVIAGGAVGRTGEVEDALVQATDIHATILELMGFYLEGGINNSLSLRTLLDEPVGLQREIIYTDYDDDGLLVWATRTSQYKLIEDENGHQEFYDVQADLQEQDNLIGALTAEQQAVMFELEAEAAVIRSGWSCHDGIRNGDEMAIDDCAVVLSTSEDWRPNPVRVWPNPSSGTLGIQTDDHLDHQVRLFSVDGRLVREEQGVGLIRMTDLPKGTFLLTLDNRKPYKVIVR